MTATASPVRPGWSRSAGLRVETEAHGALRALALGDIVVNLFVANALEGGPANLALRRHHGDTTAATVLLGPRSPTRWQADPQAGRLDGIGQWDTLRYRVALRLAADAPAWFWHLQVENTGREPVRIDAMAWQDLALTTDAALRLNEYYVSQYIDHTPLVHPQRGVVLAARQNQPVGARHPWCLVGSLNRSVAYATDALQVYGRAARAGAPPPCLAEGLPSQRLQHEHAMAALQDAPCELAPGAVVDLGWFGRVVADHPAATSEADLALVDETLALPEARTPVWGDLAGAEPAAPNLFSASPLLASLPLFDAMLDARFGTARRHVERDDLGCVLSFFHGPDAHVVLRDKELAVLRPHGQILRTGTHREPDERALTSTVWMGGVFHSMLTQGHVSINRCLSTVRSYLGLFRSHGLRVFVEGEGGGWQLLDQPSAFEMRPDVCTWIYRHAAGEIEVASRAHSDPHALDLDIRFVSGAAARCLVVLHVALDGDDGRSPARPQARLEDGAALIAPAPGSPLAQRFPQGHLRLEPGAGTTIEQLGGDELLFLDGQPRETAWLALRIAPAPSVRLTLRGRFVIDGPDVPAAAAADAARLGPLRELGVPAASPHDQRLAALADLMPWLEQNALVHYLAPRGLEQFSGGGWGTRDVSQGPVELLLAQGRHEAVRTLLLRVMKAQQPDGDWPQWFMFFERDAAIRAGDSHGDIVFWPLLALGQYLIASGDATVLDEPVPFHRARRPIRPAAAPSLWAHVLRALALIRRRTIAGTALPAYGHGDWNDALQPADPALREKLCSAWTATLHHQTLTTLARGLRGIGRGRAAIRLEREAEAVRRDFARLLIADGVLAGYARFDGSGEAQRIELLLHPRDRTTGVRYSLLAMIHAILENLFDPDQMREHLRLIA
ncbi:MAG TPA: hypothetical protein VIO33_00685, partial [Burkholderiaceae bacterium]